MSHRPKIMFCSKPPPSHLWKLRCTGCAHSHTECFPWDINVYESERMNEMLLSFSQTRVFERHLLDKGTGRTQKMQHQPIVLPQLQSGLVVGRGGCQHPIALQSMLTASVFPALDPLPSAPAWTPAVSHQKGTILLDLSDALQWWTECHNGFFWFSK